MNAMKNILDKFSDHANCPIRHVLDRFGDKWSILVIEMLGEKGKLRFTEISHHIGDISQKMLTVTLRSLEADGLVLRKHFPEIPPRVEYELTATGKSLLPHIEDLSAWAEKNMDLILKSRKRFLAKQGCPKDAG
jgi:DNA-binding HxlR family transcriptional regulator